MNDFGSYLTTLRKKAGYGSLDGVVAVLHKKSNLGIKISKARLSLYERGEVDTLKPEILRTLASVYQVSYAELAESWFRDRYLRDETTNLQLSKIDLAHSSELELEDSSLNQSVSLKSVKYVEQLQSKLSAGSQVAVSALRFLDDSIYFEMVSKNIKKGVSYVYLLPESEKATYYNLLSRLVQKFPSLAGKLDGQRTHFIARTGHEVPLNGLLFIHPSQRVDGFVGILEDDRPCLFQAVQDRAAMRLLRAFAWHLRVARDPACQKVLSKLAKAIERKGRESFRLIL